MFPLPFPPKITGIEVFTRKKGRKVPTKAPNNFIIYRSAYVKELNSKGHYLPMKILSPIISKKWKTEPDSLKAEYTRIANEATRLLNEAKLGLKTQEEQQWSLYTYHQSDLQISSPPSIQVKHEEDRRDIQDMGVEKISNNLSSVYYEIGNRSSIKYDSQNFNFTEEFHDSSIGINIDSGKDISWSNDQISDQILETENNIDQKSSYLYSSFSAQRDDVNNGIYDTRRSSMSSCADFSQPTTPQEQSFLLNLFNDTTACQIAPSLFNFETPSYPSNQFTLPFTEQNFCYSQNFSQTMFFPHFL
ncbi:hypothetical protein G9A89_010210 [Geosiphon pyriformis]|nr:hypothetical protein G9A89_010210 [Geosiphon pyriformis]